MQRKFLVIFIAGAFCLLIILGSLLGVFSFLGNSIGFATSKIIQGTFNSNQFVLGANRQDQIAKLQSQNQELTNKLIQMQSVKNDNIAYKDQFAATPNSTARLLPAHIVGAPTFIPGVTTIETLVLDKGSKDGVKIGQAIVYENNLVGQVTKVSLYLSEVKTISAIGTSLTAQTSTGGALGVIKGQGTGHMLFDNVNTTDKLAKGDIVVTRGNVTVSGIGLPPGLILGKVIAVTRQPSALFQSADVLSQVNIERASMLFIFINYE